ncbi:MAG: cell surface protein SprA, partial [Flavobacteriaceae bacterium]|nr:cell surface protein SprA [Flavobacteriaceae bacterium]
MKKLLNKHLKTCKPLVNSSNNKYYLLFLSVFIFSLLKIQAQTPPNSPISVDSTKAIQQKIDTTKTDTIKPPLRYPFSSAQKGSLFLNQIRKMDVVYDPDREQYIFLEKIGDYYIEHPFYMTKEEYKKYRLQKDIAEYFKEKSTAFSSQKNRDEAQKNLLPKYYVRSEFFENIFGGNEIEVNPQGSVLVKMGVLYQKVENPQLSERNRASTTFDFDQEISASLNAKVGKRLRVNASFDTQSTFNFQNQIKLEYTPTEDDIIRKIEVGNVSMPIQSSLISGAQNLFGVKTQLQFGKTTVTGVFSQQRSQTRSVQAQGGATINEFELRASNYDENRHFFLAQQFRDDYNEALARLPLINSSKFITRIEIWITNRNNTTEDVRNIVALADLGETDPSNFTTGSNITPDAGLNPGPRNGANSLDGVLIAGGGIRNISSVDSELTPFNLQQGSGYSILENARKLTLNIDFTLNPQLGYITLNRQLADSDILAVAYEYTDTNRSNPDNPDNPSVFRVGELSGDGVTAPDNLVVKLLRSEILNPSLPIFDLMMKNVYALPGAFQLQRDGFRLEVLYQDDETGVPINFLQNAQTVIAGDPVSEIPLLNLLRFDILDGSNAPIPRGDGYFDYIEGITVDSQNGYVIFPSVEPFGGRGDPTSTNPLDSGELGEILSNPSDDKFVFDELYDRTQVQAQTEFQNKDKYFLKGYFKSESRNGISLGAFNIPRGSVTVTSGGRELLEGVDYIVDYQIGTVQVINPNLIASNAPINATVENNTGFNQQRRRFMGLDIQHIFDENFAIGGTIINLNERPFTQKPQFGAEPVNNTMVGFNLNYQTQVPAFTKWVNNLPNIDTDVESSFSIRAEAAYLFPGSPKGIDLNNEAASYVDDFEGSQIPLDISSPRQWFLASTPENINLPVGDPLNFRDADVPANIYQSTEQRDKLRVGAERSQLAWYTIDRLFYGSQLKPSNIDDNELSRSEVRRVNFEELFPQLQLDITQTNIINTFDLAYYPQERGSYNFNEEATLSNNTYGANPEDKWAGIMRSLTTTDFQQANIEYIQFWLMDPYNNYSITPQEGAPANVNPATDFGGDLYFNLGNVSEDILDDNRRMYENGLPPDGNKIIGTNVTDEFYSFIPINQSLIYAFSEEDSERPNQDVGLDGRNNQEEEVKFSTAFGEDPSNDDFQFFRGSDLDAADAGILQRYKRFNKTQGNSPTINNSAESFPTSATSFPDIEDINQDQTMSDIESYYQYKISLFPNDLDINRPGTTDNPNYIVDQKEELITLPNGQTQTAKWYQFRIPITTGTPIGGISGFNAIRFIRMYLTKFRVPVVLRFGELELIRGDWRRYLFTINDNNPLDPPQPLTADEDQSFEVGVVNIQENEDKQPFPYVLPPGVRRERLQGSTTVQEQNEQSLLLKVNNLAPGETRAVFKNTQFDMRMFKNLRMYVHAASVPGVPDTEDGELTAILRLGSDTNDNFYQIEVPLRITKIGENSADSIWKNDFDTQLRQLGQLKLERQNINFPNNELFPSLTGEPEARVRVKGSPNLSNIRTIMLGVRNDALNDKTAELWFNELRVSDFDNEGGWAAVVNADANFADFADISIAGRANSQGFGSIDQRPNERSQEDVKQYDIVTNINLGQLLPKKAGIKIPLNYSISEEFRDPRWDPQFQDVLFEDALESNTNSENSRDYTKRRSIN